MMGLFRLHHRPEAAMTRIPRALKRIKADVQDALPESVVRSRADDLDRTHHHRTLTPVVTTCPSPRQLLNGNPAGGELRHRGGLDFTDSASCQARQRLPVGFSMPDTPGLREQFGRPAGQAEGCGFPTAHPLVQIDLADGFLLRAPA